MDSPGQMILVSNNSSKPGSLCLELGVLQRGGTSQSALPDRALFDRPSQLAVVGGISD